MNYTVITRKNRVNLNPTKVRSFKEQNLSLPTLNIFFTSQTAAIARRWKPRSGVAATASQVTSPGGTDSR